MLDKNSHVPIYIQISNNFLKMIENGELKPGDAILSENQLAAGYKISRMTAKKAVDNLMMLGKVERIRGKGTFIKRDESKIELPLNKLRSFTQKVREMGKEPMNRVLELKIIIADQEISRFLGIKKGDEVFYMERLRLVDDIPAVFEQSYMPKYLVPDLTREDLLKSKFEYIWSKGYKIGYSEREILAQIPSEYICEILQLKRTEPILYATCLTKLLDGRTLEYSQVSYNQRKYKFKLITEME
ncbi:MAG: GntR family transcriptional regulator [Fusobacteriaceae bacterium]